MEHHRYQGEDGVDTDIPTIVEGKVFNSTLKKLMFVIFQVFFYAFRPLIVNPKKPGRWELINFLACFGFDLVVAYFLGGSAVAYFLLGTVLGM